MFQKLSEIGTEVKTFQWLVRGNLSIHFMPKGKNPHTDAVRTAEIIAIIADTVREH